MATPTAAEVYLRHIKHLPRKVRLELLALTTQDLAAEEEATPATRKRSLMELHGLGKELWEGIDAQEYVNELRGEWDHRP